MYVESLKGQRGEAPKNLVFSSKWMPQNCLLAYISMNLRENLSTPFSRSTPPFSFLTPFNRNFRNPSFQLILGNSNPPFRKGGPSYVPSIFICKKWKKFNDHFTSIWLKTLYSWQSILVFRVRLFYEITSYLKNSHYYLLLACKK